MITRVKSFKITVLIVVKKTKFYFDKQVLKVILCNGFHNRISTCNGTLALKMLLVFLIF